MFSQERVAQMAAFFLHLGGGKMAYIKVLKLLYLADRDAMGKWGESISGDEFVSMPYGPVLSQTYALIRDSGTSTEFGWDYWIQDDANYEVSLKNKFNHNDELDELSEIELNILKAVFSKFGQMKKFELVNYTHDYCAEWEDPLGSSFPISPESIFRALGKNDNEINALIQQHNIQTQLSALHRGLK